MSVRWRSARPLSDETPRTNARSQKREAPISTVQMSASMTKTSRGKSPSVCVASRMSERDDLGDDDGGDDARRVARAGVAPDSAVEAERDERQIARGEHDGERDGEDVPLVVDAAAAEAQAVRRRERGA